MAFVGSACCLAAAACREDAVTTTSLADSVEAAAVLSQPPGEGELIGNVLLNGALASGYYVTLTAIDEPTQERLVEFDGSMWASPNRHNGRAWMFEWIDPRADGACGNLANYLAGNINARGAELHWKNPTTPPSGKEKHCIRPGQYELRISTNSGGLNPIKTVRIDYVPTHAVAIPNTILGETEHLEILNYDTTDYAWQDIFVIVETGSVGGSDNPILYIQNSGKTPYSSSFSDQADPGGSKFDYFHFSSRASTTSIPATANGRLLSRLWWDATAPSLRSGFWDSHDQKGVIRIHQFLEVTSTGTYDVGLETMRPSEQPLTAPQYTRPVGIEVPVPALPSVSTWVSGPDMLQPTEPTGYSWTQQASGGVPAYHYGNWSFYRYPGPETLVGFGTGYDRTVSPTASPYVFRLRAGVTDDSAQTAVGKYFVEVIEPGGGGGALVDSGSDGVRLANGTCGQRPPSGPERQRWLEWVFEHRQARVERCRY